VLARAPSSRRGPVVAVLAVTLFAAIAGESVFRDRTPEPVDARVLVALAENRAHATEELLAAACEGGCCAPNARPAVAAFEVQLRFALDDRVDVLSFDGRTSPVTYDARGCPVVDAVLADPRVVAAIDPPLTLMPTCRAANPIGAALTDAWGAEGATSPRGWAWSKPLDGWMRVCRAADQPEQ
jgi:hypothetical protein